MKKEASPVQKAILAVVIGSLLFLVLIAALANGPDIIQSKVMFSPARLSNSPSAIPSQDSVRGTDDNCPSPEHYDEASGSYNQPSSYLCNDHYSDLYNCDSEALCRSFCISRAQKLVCVDCISNLPEQPTTINCSCNHNNPNDCCTYYLSKPFCLGYEGTAESLYEPDYYPEGSRCRCFNDYFARCKRPYGCTNIALITTPDVIPHARD